MHRQNKKDWFFYTNKPQKWLRLNPFTDGCLLCHICFPLVVSWGFSPSSLHISLFLKDFLKDFGQDAFTVTSYIFIPTAQSAIDFGSITGAIRKNNRNGERKENFLSSSSASTITHWRSSPWGTESPSLVCMKRLQRSALNVGVWRLGRGCCSGTGFIPILLLLSNRNPNTPPPSVEGFQQLQQEPCREYWISFTSSPVTWIPIHKLLAQ